MAGMLGVAARWALFGVLLALFSPRLVDGCSCYQGHPQSYVCNSDFVIVARVKKHFPEEGVYKVHIKKEFVTSEKASLALKSGRLRTALQSSMCGLSLEVDETYLLGGRIVGGKPWIGLCDLHHVWKDVSLRQKKHYRLLYKIGCRSCQIEDCRWQRSCPTASDRVCQVSPFGDCSHNAVCTVQKGGKCGWTQDKMFKECSKWRRQVVAGRSQRWPIKK